MIGLDFVYILAGLMFGAFALQHAFDTAEPRRWPKTLFWGSYALTFLLGSVLPDAVSGALVVFMVLLAGFGGIGGGAGMAGYHGRAPRECPPVRQPPLRSGSAHPGRGALRHPRLEGASRSVAGP